MKHITLAWTFKNLPSDVIRGMIVAVVIEVIRHYLKPKDESIHAIDYAIDAFHGERR